MVSKLAKVKVTGINTLIRFTKSTIGNQEGSNYIPQKDTLFTNFCYLCSVVTKNSRIMMTAEELMGLYKKVRDEKMVSGGLGLITNPNAKKEGGIIK